MQDHRIQQAGIYTDFSGLNALKNQAGDDRKGALEEVARQFEGLFLSQMLKSMRAANKVLAEGNYLNSQQSEFYQDMFDSQLSLSMSRGQGMGLTDAMVRQLGRNIPGMDENGSELPGARRTLADYDRSLPPLSPRLPERVEDVNRLLDESMPAARDDDAALVAEVAVPADPSVVAGLPERFGSPKEFVSSLLPLATEVAAETGINPRLMVAQAALETGWGRHMIEGSDGEPSFNLFGIKADQRWSGEAVNIATTEFREGVPMNERADFRRYTDYRESFRDYVDFLKSNPRYREALSVADQPELFAERLQQAGYATDPRYGAKIRSIMHGEPFEAALSRLQPVSRGIEE
ncbi:flagellar assembly peptidoglycan hydrolase FlgJ [uncultured Marinobacter sp.]|uniref:flagellar assembly peptidoglycan hydrolase FlgJ n=1 Tax=uncultured Marinobacter sp. TaxID=187379 RepID=UPI0030D6D07D